MPKIPRFTSKELIKLLQSNNFYIDHATGGHYVFYNNETKRRTIVPYHSKNLPIGTIKSILNSAGIEIKKDKKFF
ncbi:MAG: type II toxin-antitoxin system HicA family toxin [Candidatus Paceibacterota bacterium]|jgi:predicted RNA binding protein YcfA (HicA-like mRNA interferase family)